MEKNESISPEPYLVWSIVVFARKIDRDDIIVMIPREDGQYDVKLQPWADDVSRFLKIKPAFTFTHTFAGSEDEAVAIGRAMAEKEFPVSQAWVDPQVFISM